MRKRCGLFEVLAPFEKAKAALSGHRWAVKEAAELHRIVDLGSE